MHLKLSTITVVACLIAVGVQASPLHQSANADVSGTVAEVTDIASSTLSIVRDDTVDTVDSVENAAKNAATSVANAVPVSYGVVYGGHDMNVNLGAKVEHNGHSAGASTGASAGVGAGVGASAGASAGANNKAHFNKRQAGFTGSNVGLTRFKAVKAKQESKALGTIQKAPGGSDLSAAVVQNHLRLNAEKSQFKEDMKLF
ncbi:hypothetical protein BDF14DRAFT_1841114, partial [Spinellus fusiger]